MRLSLRLRRKSEDKDKEDKESNYIVASLAACLTIAITNHWWPEILASLPVFGAPFWEVKGGPGTWISAVWPIFAWGIGLNLIVGLVHNSNHATSFERLIRRRREPSAGDILVGGTLISLFAGVTEELAFRWLLFLGAIAGAVFSNWLFGTVGLYIMLGVIFLLLSVVMGKNESFYGLVTAGILTVVLVFIIHHGPYIDPIEWFNNEILVPFADWASFGKMHNLLITDSPTNPDAWAIGAGLITANARFRDGHKYQGPLGIVNSWYIGLVMFWLMFTYGLVAAIAIHFLYDFGIFATVAFMRLFRR